VADLGIKIGDPITFDGELRPLGGSGRIVSQYIDDRAGIAALVTLASRIREISPRPDVFLVATIEEEIGLRGASTAAFRLKPDLAISVDTQPAGGTPEYDFHQLPLVIGKGPAIKFTENARVTNHPRVRQLLIDAAEQAGVPYQLAAAPPGGSDMGAMEQAGEGVPAAAIGLPRRYAHSPNEVIDLQDLLGVVRTLEQAIGILGEGYSLQRV
jgi:endoglucanase